MFFCGKKVGYLSAFRNGIKMGTGGFVKMLREGNCLHVIIQIKLPEKIDGSYIMFISAKEGRIKAAQISLTEGRGIWERSFECSESDFVINGKAVSFEEITGFVMEIEKDTSVEVQWEQKEEVRQEKKQSSSFTVAEKKKEVSDVSMQDKECRQQIYAAESYSQDKWEQLKNTFQQVHPFGDERVYISIAVKDFVILRQEYQKLVHNSFLLHGFYNYGHLILGKDHKIGNSYETCFYLGVPGVFYEKEKMVAVMFGFEGFECEGAVSIGKSGYYLRQIQI